MNPNFDSSGKHCSLAFQTCAFGWKTFICYWKCLLKVLLLSDNFLINIMMLNLSGLDLGVPPSSYFMNLALSSIDLPLFQYRPSTSLIGSLYRGEFL